MEKIIHIIKKKNWEEILLYTKALSDEDRYSTLETLQKIDIDTDLLKGSGADLTGEKRVLFYKNRQELDNFLSYFKITCTRDYKDIKKLDIKLDYGTFNSYNSFITKNNIALLIPFYKLFPPTYLDKIIKGFSKNEFNDIHFNVLWGFYKNGWISFDESVFIKSLLVIPMFNRSTVEDAAFLFDNRDALEEVFLKFHEHETPILDISKWEAKDGFVCKKVYEFWTEVILLLQEKGYEFDRVIISHLFESLLNNWKKLHLDWHVRLLKFFKPTSTELLKNQSTLFSILGTGHNSLMNYAMQSIKSIHTDKNFDRSLFVESFPIMFSNEKTEKSILIGLNILEFFLKESFTVDLEYREKLAILLMQAEPKTQEKAANILVDFFKDVDLKECVTPYASYIKQKTQDILKIEEQVEASIFESTPSEEIEPIHLITNWDTLLMHIGTCIRTKSARDIDVFYESLNQLQFEIPADFEKQLKPYTKQLSNRHWENYVMITYASFITFWASKTIIPIRVTEHNPIPFLLKKSELLIGKLGSKNNLPFLSTPTHEPFYVDPISLLDKLLQYEERKEAVNLEDLIVACNRILISKINSAVTKKSKQLTGYYAEAIQYLFGATSKINHTVKTLPLWTQIARIKSPNVVFSEFENSSAAGYPTIAMPFEHTFDITVDANEYVTWYRLTMHDNWNFTWYNKTKTKTYPSIFYNTAPSGKATREDIAFQLSLNPSYLDPQLCRYLPDTTSGNEVSGFEDCLFPLQFILENQIRIFHSGWLYVATCLLFEKKISRDLASEYIQLAISRKENLDHLASVLGTLISLKFAPVNRFIEYLDKPNDFIEVTQFQLQVLYASIMSFDKESLPRSCKKIVSYYKETLTSLKLQLPKEIEKKLKKIKK